jgi:3-hydroxy-4-methylanthranilate adenylyltransferase
VSASHLGGVTARQEMTATGTWVDEHLLAGPGHEVCLRLGATAITRDELRAEVDAQARALTAAGLRPGGSVALRLPPSRGYVVSLLAAWRIGAQVALLDHRLTGYEVELALSRIAPQFVVSATGLAGSLLRGYAELSPVVEQREGEPARTGHALLQLSSGSTGPSKVIGRSAADLLTEIGRYQQLDGYPARGERVVLLASMVHVLGLVGGLLYCLATGVDLVLPEFLTSSAILDAVAADHRPTTILGVPFHLGLLAAVDPAPRLSNLVRMTVGGEVVREPVRRAFTDRYAVPLGVMYGMTEVGVIATDLSGRYWPRLAPVPGMTVREDGGQLRIARPESPYVGLIDPTRWVDGWLHTKDAGTVDGHSGLIRVTGRLDSQVSVGGLKVDLTEVEHTLAELPGVAEVVVAHDGVIRAFVAFDPPEQARDLDAELATRLATYKRPQQINVLPRLPRTSSGKLVRDLRALGAAATSAPAQR